MSFSPDTIDRIKELADPELIMELLGFRVFRRGHKELRARCILHGGDNPTAFRMRTDSKRFSCYTKQCHVVSGVIDNDLISLIMKARGVGFNEAVTWLAEVVGFDTENVKDDAAALLDLYRRRDIKKTIESANRLSSRETPLQELPSSYVGDSIVGRSSYFTDMGISEGTQEFFGVGYKVYPDGVPRATIPIRDVYGKLVSVSGRRVDSNDEPRYKLVADFDKARVLYNLNNAVKMSPLFDNTLVIVEGFKAAWAVHDVGFSNVVACMGAYLLEPQVETLSEYLPTAKCLVMMDGDEAGGKGLESSMRVCRKYFKAVAAPLHIDYPGKSPDDLPQEERMAYIERYMKLL